MAFFAWFEYNAVIMKNIIEIIHQDVDFIVINKPPGVSVTKDRSGADDLLAILRKQLPAQNDLRLVHRLDKYTSGVMLVATTPPAQSRLSSWFEKRKIKKTYLALVSGYAGDEKGTIDIPLAHSKKDDRLMVVNRKRGKPAITHWQLLADFGMVSLLAVQPVTSRTHQIRLHLASKGLPMAIDPLYGATRPLMLSDFKHGYTFKKQQKETPLIDRLTLHAYQLEIPSEDSAPLIYTAKLEKKFAAAIKMLTKHNPKGPEAFENQDNLTRILDTDPL